jgi:hypothetical protein
MLRGLVMRAVMTFLPALYVRIDTPLYWLVFDCLTALLLPPPPLLLLLRLLCDVHDGCIQKHTTRKNLAYELLSTRPRSSTFNTHYTIY